MSSRISLKKKLKQRKIDSLNLKKKNIVKLILLYFNKNNFKNILNQFFYKKLFFLKVYKTTFFNFCYITGRSAAIYSIYNVSRIILKEVNYMYYFGLKKSSW